MLTIIMKGVTIMNEKRIRMKEEAIKRLEKLGVANSVIKDFKDGILNASEQGLIPGALYHLTDEEKQMVEKIENEYGGMVFHCIRCNTNFGVLFNMLWVSKYEEEWEYDNEHIEDFIVFAYVENLSDSLCSEFGSIAVAKRNGGLIRVG